MNTSWLIGVGTAAAIALLGLMTYDVVLGRAAESRPSASAVAAQRGDGGGVAGGDAGVVSGGGSVVDFGGGSVVDFSVHAAFGVGRRAGDDRGSRDGVSSIGRAGVYFDADAVDFDAGAVGFESGPGVDFGRRASSGPVFGRAVGGAGARPASAALALPVLPDYDLSIVRAIYPERAMHLHGIDYTDPVEGGAVPLVPVWGRRDVAVSKHFRVRDFAARDGAPYARISFELVAFLDSLTDHLGTRVHVTSAYRHPALNFRTGIDGAAESRHMAGLAADIWAEGKTALEIAQAVLDVRGCEVGLGLGAYSVHVDLRDYTASWAYEEAKIAEADFDLWVLDRCAETFDDRARLLAEQPPCRAPATGIHAAEAFGKEMISLARLQRERGSHGAVLLDVRSADVPADDVHADSVLADVHADDVLSADVYAADRHSENVYPVEVGSADVQSDDVRSIDPRADGVYSDDVPTLDSDSADVQSHAADDVASRLAFLPVDSPLLRLMGLQRLVERAEENDSFVFVVVDRDGTHRSGLMRYSGEQVHVLAALAEHLSACE